MLINEYVLKNLKEVGRHTDDQTKGLHRLKKEMPLLIKNMHQIGLLIESGA